MVSIKLKFRACPDNSKEGFLYFQLIHTRIVKQIKTDYRIYENEWNNRQNDIARVSPISNTRNETLKVIRNKIMWEKRRMEWIIQELSKINSSYKTDDIIKQYKKLLSDKISVFEYIKQQSERLKKLGKVRTSETYQQTLNSFMKYRNNVDLNFDMLNADLVEQYESYMRMNCLSRNSTSFYMRILRCIYNRAVKEGLVIQSNLFKRVYTGVDKTAKRAITLKEIKRIKELNLVDKPDLDYARDIFLFSFYMRGMSFIDIAYLRKKDLSNGYVVYTRKKTGKRLVIRWEKSMQDILSKYDENPTQYLLPIITKQDGTERKQYLNKILFVNRKLKQVAAMVKIVIPLSMYVSRHSWACIAQSKNVPLSIISEGMGHDNEETTRIYLSTIRTNLIDDANNKILKELQGSLF